MLDDQTLRRIQNNVRNLTELKLSPTRIHGDIDLRTAGRGVGKNSHIRVLWIIDFDDETTIEAFKHIFGGISKNISIQVIYFVDCQVTGGLLDLLRLDALVELYTSDCRLTYETVAALRNAKNLQRISLDVSMEPECRMLMESEIFTAINANNRLRELSLDGIELGKNGCDALEKMLLNPKTALKTLSFSSGLNDQILRSVSNGLASNDVLEELYISGNRNQITTQGWESLSAAVATSCAALRNIQITHISVCDEGLIALSRAISRQQQLKVLNISDLRSVSENAMMNIISAALSPSLCLTKLDLNGNDSVTDDALAQLSNVLVVMKNTLEELSICRCRNVSANGLVQFSYVFHNSDLKLKRFRLACNAINDYVILSLVEGLCKDSCLEELNIGSSTLSIGSPGWSALAGLLQKKSSELRELYIHNNGVNDDIFDILAKALIENKKLQKLYLGVRPSLTARGWHTLSNLLCNTSSIKATRYSNHTLCNLGQDSGAPLGIKALLQKNNDSKEAEVVRWKVIKAHFSNYFDSSILCQDYFQGELLHHTMSWFGKDSLGSSALYELIRNLPETLKYHKQEV